MKKVTFRYVYMVALILFFGVFPAEAKMQNENTETVTNNKMSRMGISETSMLEGTILGKSQKAKLVTLQLDEQIEFISFNDQTEGLEYALKGENVVIRYQKEKIGKIALELMPKLAQLPEGVEEIFADELVELVDDKQPEKYLLVDVRGEQKYKEGHIPTAVSLPLSTLLNNDNRLEQLVGDSEKKIIFYSNGMTCGLCTKAAEFAVGRKHKNIKVLLSGFRGWEDEGELMAVSDELISNGQVVLIDTRKAADANAGHIPEAIGIPLDELVDEVEYDLPTQRVAPIVFYGVDVDVLMAADIVRNWGFRHVLQVDGGYKGWIERGGLPAVGAALGSDKISWQPVAHELHIAKKDFLKLAASESPNVTILDVRTNLEAEKGGFTKALHIPLEELASRLSEIPKGKGVVTHCASGARAEMAALYLGQYMSDVRFLPAKVRCKGEKCRVK